MCIHSRAQSHAIGNPKLSCIFARMLIKTRQSWILQR